MHALRSFHAVATTVAIAAVVTACGDPAHPPAAPFVGASDAPGADAFSDTATDAPVEAPPSTTMSFDKWLTPTIWTKLKRAIAVDTTGRIFVTDGATVFAVSDQGVPSIYLTATELLAAIGSTISSPDIESLDVDADGKLYLLDRSLKEQIFLSPAAHSVAKFNDLAGLTFPKLISVVSPDRILVVHSDGLSEVTAAGVKSIYPRETLGGSTDCFSEAFGARRDGFVYYAPGCTGNDLNGGKSDGTGIGVLARNDDVYNGIGKAHFIDFSGIARDQEATGGYVVAEEVILHFDAAGKYARVVTAPSIGDRGRGEGLTFGFHGSPIGAGPNGVLYVLAFDEGIIFRASK